jgi:hypothetical protein
MAAGRIGGGDGGASWSTMDAGDSGNSRGFRLAYLGGSRLGVQAMLRDAGLRWSVASALGVAIAAVVGMWGQSFATSDRDGDGSYPDFHVMASGPRSVAVLGSPAGSITTGDAGTAPRSSTEHDGSPVPKEPSPPSSARGSVIASGERSIAIGGSPAGDLSTGDQQPPASRA